jgi:hypothetical protein
MCSQHGAARSSLPGWTGPRPPPHRGDRRSRMHVPLTAAQTSLPCRGQADSQRPGPDRAPCCRVRRHSSLHTDLRSHATPCRVQRHADADVTHAPIPHPRSAKPHPGPPPSLSTPQQSSTPVLRCQHPNRAPHQFWQLRACASVLLRSVLPEVAFTRWSTMGCERETSTPHSIASGSRCKCKRTRRAEWAPHPRGKRSVQLRMRRPPHDRAPSHVLDRAGQRRSLTRPMWSPLASP